MLNPSPWWLLAVATASLLLGLLPHVVTLLKPPLGQLPGLSLLINHSVCFAHRFGVGLLALAAFCSFTGRANVLNSSAGFLGLVALFVHLTNYYVYHAVLAKTRIKVDRWILEGAEQRKGISPALHSAIAAVATNDDSDALGKLLQRWWSFVPLAIASVWMTTKFVDRDIVRHASVEYLPAGGPNEKACDMAVMYSRDPASYAKWDKRPVAIYMHGGAWCFGHKIINGGPALRYYLAKQGFLVATISYRFAPVNPWPAQLVSLVAACRWIHANYGRHPCLPAPSNADSSDQPFPMVSIGASAGAHVNLCFSLLGALVKCGRAERLHQTLRVAVEAAVAEGAMPDAVVALYPPVDIRDRLGLYMTFPCSLPPLFRASVRPTAGESMFGWFFMRVVAQLPASKSPAADDKQQELLAQSSPMELLDMLKAEYRQSVKNASDLPALSTVLPPICTVHCDGDGVVPIVASSTFMDRLRDLRAAHAEHPSKDRFIDVPAVGHSFDILLTQLSANVARGIFAWSATVTARHQ